jgi:hypothetical protein
MWLMVESSELPRPEDPELAALYDCEVYEQHLKAAREAVRLYPETSARVLALAWLHFERWIGYVDAPA